MEHRKKLDLVPEHDRLSDYDCPFCGTVVPHGYLVCLGCQAEVVYGSTHEEMQQDQWGGFLVGGALVLTVAWLVSDRLPVWSRVGIFLILVLIMGGGTGLGYWYALREDQDRRQTTPRFFREQRAARVSGGETWLRWSAAMGKDKNNTKRPSKRRHP